VREDDVPRSDPPSSHNAGGPSPGILRFIHEVVDGTPQINIPPKPAGFRSRLNDHYPGRGNADVHYEGRAVDVHLNYNSPVERAYGDWLFAYCIANCQTFQIQGVIWGPRRWFSEAHNGQVSPEQGPDHYDHVHLELNCDGANTP